MTILQEAEPGGFQSYKRPHTHLTEIEQRYGMIMYEQCGWSPLTKDADGMVLKSLPSDSGPAAKAGGDSLSPLAGGGLLSMPSFSPSGVVRLSRGGSEPPDRSGILSKLSLGSWVFRLEGGLALASASCGGGGDGEEGLL